MSNIFLFQVSSSGGLITVKPGQHFCGWCARVHWLILCAKKKSTHVISILFGPSNFIPGFSKQWVEKAKISPPHCKLLFFRKLSDFSTMPIFQETCHSWFFALQINCAESQIFLLSTCSCEIIKREKKIPSSPTFDCALQEVFINFLYCIFNKNPKNSIVSPKWRFTILSNNKHTMMNLQARSMRKKGQV